MPGEVFHRRSQNPPQDIAKKDQARKEAKAICRKLRPEERNQGQDRNNGENAARGQAVEQTRAASQKLDQRQREEKKPEVKIVQSGRCQICKDPRDLRATR